MNLLAFLLIIVFLIFIYFKVPRKGFLRLKKKPFNRKEMIPINDWMELTKQQRKDIDLRDKQITLERKKALLKSIRDEYSRMIKK